jgi:hypothetical protein
LVLNAAASGLSPQTLKAIALGGKAVVRVVAIPRERRLRIVSFKKEGVMVRQNITSESLYSRLKVTRFFR